MTRTHLALGAVLLVSCAPTREARVGVRIAIAGDPDALEARVTIPLEEALAAVPSVSRLESLTAVDAVAVVVTAREASAAALLAKIGEAVARARAGFPSGAAVEVAAFESAPAPLDRSTPERGELACGPGQEVLVRADPERAMLRSLLPADLVKELTRVTARGAPSVQALADAALVPGSGTRVGDVAVVQRVPAPARCDRALLPGSAERRLLVQGASPAVLERVANDIRGALAGIPGASVMPALAPPPRLVAVPDRERLEKLGVRAEDVSPLAQLARDGVLVGRVEDAGRELPVRARWPVGDAQALGAIPVRAAGGTLSPLDALVQTRAQRGLDPIVRVNRSRAVVVSFRTDGGDLRPVKRAAREALARVDLPPGVAVVWSLE